MEANDGAKKSVEMTGNLDEGAKKTIELMGNSDGKAENGRKTTVTDLDLDTLVMCAAKLQLRDLANMAVVCHQFRLAAYADSVWEDQCRTQWPPQIASWGGTFQFCGGRDAFVGRYHASQQFRYHDPVDWTTHLPPSPITHILKDNDSVAVSQGSNISIVRIGCPSSSQQQQPEVVRILRDHNARITCMRLFPRELVPHSFRNGVMGPDNNLLVTSSTDHTIRLWGSGRPRTFRGHGVAVSALADRLLGRSGSGAVLASGGEDGRVRLWSFTSVGGNRGKSPLVATFHAHSEAVKELVVAGHNDSLLVSTSRSVNPKIRVWDANASTTASGCVGTMNGPEGIAVKLVCDGSTCFVAGGTRVMAFDLRTMSSVATVAVGHEPGIASFARSPNGTVFGTGGYDKTAKLWDMRMCGDEQPGYLVSLGDYVGPVHCLHVDRYKVVSGGQMDRLVRVWDANTGSETSALDTIELDIGILRCGVSAMAVHGPRLLTGTCGDVSGVLRYRDFSNCTNLLDTDEVTSDCRSSSTSKFWESDLDRSSKT